VTALSAESPAADDDLDGRALASGAAKAQEPIADGPMYGWSFLDPDGHHWELIHMDV
jgi:predicted lactoylglutathione lyase